LKNLVIETNHYTDKIPRNHKVIGITKESARALTIQTEDGQSISMKNYFLENYQKKITFLDLLCLILSSKSANYMPIEFCFIVENQQVKDELEYIYSKKYNRIMLPSTRIQTISNYVKEILNRRSLEANFTLIY